MALIFVTGPLYAGKKTWIRERLGLTEAELAACAVWDVQNLVPTGKLEELADELVMRRSAVVWCRQIRWSGRDGKPRGDFRACWRNGQRRWYVSAADCPSC